MFDGDLWHRPAEAAKLATLEAEVKASGQVVVVVRLPKDKDPGDMTHREIWDTLAAQSIAAGVEPPWLKEPA
jgi:DNA primase